MTESDDGLLEQGLKDAHRRTAVGVLRGGIAMWRERIDLSNIVIAIINLATVAVGLTLLLHVGGTVAGGLGAVLAVAGAAGLADGAYNRWGERWG